MAGGLWARRLGLRGLLLLATAMAALSQGALATVTVVDGSAVLPALLVGTTLMGTGFGLSAAPLNTLPGLLFPARSEPALVALHTVLGGGFAVGPLAVSALVGADLWPALPLTIGSSCVLALLVGLRTPLPRDEGASAEIQHAAPEPPRAWLVVLGIVAVLYAFAEGTFSNWAAIFLHEARGVPEPTAAIAISGFWFGLAGGRLLVSTLVARISSVTIWLSLPVLMAAVFVLLPLASGPASGIGLFVLAGLAASAFFPLTVAFASGHYPSRVATVSSLLTAALMVGVGSGSFALGALRSSLSFDALYRVSAAYPLAALGLAAIATLGLRRARARSVA